MFEKHFLPMLMPTLLMPPDGGPSALAGRAS
jgi:hypothetical protein